MSPKKPAAKNLRTCPKGHKFLKSSDCPTCPLCEAAKKPSSGFLSGLSAPARRALEHAGLTTVKKLANRSEKEVLTLHGMGPGSLPNLRAVLKEAGLAFRAPAKKTAAAKSAKTAKSARTSKPTTIAEYIDRAPPEAQKNLRALYAVLKKAAPKATEALKWSNPVFEEGRILFAFSAHKTHINFVPTPATVTAFRDELKGYTVGKMAVSIPHDSPIPKTLIAKMAAWRLRDVRENDARWM